MAFVEFKCTRSAPWRVTDLPLPSARHCSRRGSGASSSVSCRDLSRRLGTGTAKVECLVVGVGVRVAHSAAVVPEVRCPVCVLECCVKKVAVGALVDQVTDDAAVDLPDGTG